MDQPGSSLHFDCLTIKFTVSHGMLWHQLQFRSHHQIRSAKVFKMVTDKLDLRNCDLRKNLNLSKIFFQMFSDSSKELKS